MIRISKYNQFIAENEKNLIDLSNEKIGYKIREQTLQRVPYLIIIGDKEVEDGKITLRHRDGNDLGSMSVDEFIRLTRVEC